MPNNDRTINVTGSPLENILKDSGFGDPSCSGINTPIGAVYREDLDQCVCLAGDFINADGVAECVRNDYGTLGISCSMQQAANGTCKRNLYKTLGIRKTQTTDPTGFVQDIVTAATGFIGTLIVIALIIMGIKYIMGGFSEGSSGDLKKNIKKLLIGLLLVIGSYTVIRIVMYIARGY